MTERGEVPEDLGRRMGYVLKETQAALRARMDEALRGHGLTIPQYACLELLRTPPGSPGPRELTNAELARGAFVTAQSMHLVLRTLQERGLVERPRESVSGRRHPARLTGAGERALAGAETSVRVLEDRLLAALGAEEAARTLAALRTMADALQEPADR